MPSSALGGTVRAVPLTTQARVRAAVALVAATAACGSDPRLRVDDSVLERITIENKLLLFDAENELDIAIDDRDQVLDALEAIEGEKQRAEEDRKLALRDADLFADKGDQNRSEIAFLRADATDARLDHLDARETASKVELAYRERMLVVARARFELAKARLVQRNNVPGAAEIDVEAFEEQVEVYRGKVAELEPSLREAEDRVAEREEAWSMVAARLRDASGGAYGSRWLE